MMGFCQYIIPVSGCIEVRVTVVTNLYFPLAHTMSDTYYYQCQHDCQYYQELLTIEV